MEAKGYRVMVEISLRGTVSGRVLIQCIVVSKLAVLLGQLCLRLFKAQQR